MKQLLQTILARGAKAAISRARPTVIAITGSVGKTTTRQMVVAALTQAEDGLRIVSSQKNFNNEIGLPLTIFGENHYPGSSPLNWMRLIGKSFFASIGFWQLKADILVLEMGADKPGDIAYLTSIAQPDIAIVTGVAPVDSDLAPVHVQFYPDAEAVAKEKSTLVTSLKEGGIAILNADDSRVYAMRHLTSAHILGYGENEGADIRLVSKQIRVQETEQGNVPIGLEMIVENYHKMTTLTFDGVFGTSMAYSACAAVAVINALDLADDQIKRIPERFSAMPGRTRLIPGIKHTTLLDDTYNAAPSSTISALHDLRSIPLQAGQKRIACLGEHRELGDRSEEMHRRIGREAALSNVDVFVACGIFSTAMKEGALAAGMPANRIHVFEDTPEAGLFIQSIIKPGDIVLAKSSQGTLTTKGVRMERIIKELMAEPLRAGELLVRQEKKWLQ